MRTLVLIIHVLRVALRVYYACLLLCVGWFVKVRLFFFSLRDAHRYEAVSDGIDADVCTQV